jgi:hypothetical protein
MKPEKVRKVIAKYRAMFEEKGIGKIDYPHDEMLDTQEHGLEHCHGMLDKMEQFIVEDRMDKVYRWLGFIQGVLWSFKIYVLEDMKQDNMKDPEPEPQ